MILDPYSGVHIKQNVHASDFLYWRKWQGLGGWAFTGVPLIKHVSCIQPQPHCCQRAQDVKEVPDTHGSGVLWICLCHKLREGAGVKRLLPFDKKNTSLSSLSVPSASDTASKLNVAYLLIKNSFFPEVFM